MGHTRRKSTLNIPVIDLTPYFKGDDQSRAAVAREWDAAMREFGFAIVSGHGISESLLAGVYDQAQAFFTRPLPDKMTACFGDMRSGQGYLPLGNETVGKARDEKSRPDLCESLSFSATPGARPNLWPQDIPGFRQSVESYIAAANGLVLNLMRLSASALALPEDHFAPFFTAMNSDLRCVLYPDQPDAPLEGQLRYGPHTDFSGFTILRQDSAPGGLEVKTREGWIPVRPIPGTLVINAGDLIQRWTNDRWISNIHRVVNPPRDQKSGTRRLSIVLFTGPNSDAVIECLPGCGTPRYAPIVAGEHVQQRIASTYGNLAP
jgi:isopenicillin N synthase-like dioxygenase